MILRTLLLAIGLGVFAAPAFANAVPERTLAERSELSDIVVVAAVTAVTEVEAGPDKGGRFAVATVQATLKGAAPAAIEVWTRTAIAEMDPDCCEVGKSYVFFLRRANNGRYMGVNGKFSTVRIQPAAE